MSGFSPDEAMRQIYASMQNYTREMIWVNVPSMAAAAQEGYEERGNKEKLW